ncbi:MAG: GAF domain-containing protein [Clostridiaceae bacterium]
MIKTEFTGLSEVQKLESMVNVIKNLGGEKTTSLAIISNAMAVMDVYLDRINWVGLYLLQDKTLYLGPFQGKPACMMIEEGEGVCGATIRDKKPYIVDNVLVFDGHIACDSQSRSELTVPIEFEGKILGLIDIDSPEFSRFTEAELEAVEKISVFLAPYINDLVK